MKKFMLLINKDGSHLIINNSKQDWRELVDCSTESYSEFDTREECEAYLQHYEQGIEADLNAEELRTGE